jgi:hypothetical protein
MYLKAPGLAELLTSTSYNLCCPDALQQASMTTPFSLFFLGLELTFQGEKIHVSKRSIL